MRQKIELVVLYNTWAVWQEIGFLIVTNAITTIHKGIQMNEKFKLLALEAQMGTADFDAGSYYVATPDRMQKLCELIVRECVGVVEGGSFLHDQAPTAQFARECSSAIKRHFGVEP